MIRNRQLPFLLATTALSAAAAPAQTFSFAPPARILAGENLLGDGLPFPSPTIGDLDGDGVLDVLIGDVSGNISVASGKRVDGRLSFGPERRLEAGKAGLLAFPNF